MTTADDNYEEEYSDYDSYDDDEDEAGLSGFSVLMIGLVMFGAFAATTYVFYQKGIRQGEQRAAIAAPYVAADPEPIKIETADAGDPPTDREVYDAFDGEESDAVTVIADSVEEPVDRLPEDTIGALAAEVGDVAEEEIADRVASLEAEDAGAFEPAAPEPEPEAQPVTEPTPVSIAPPQPEPVSVAGGALSGTHVVQVGAFRSNDEAMAQWSRMQARLGADVIGGKTYHVERADLGDRGVYHRLRVGPFTSSDAARDYCVTLKENGQDCLAKGI